MSNVPKAMPLQDTARRLLFVQYSSRHDGSAISGHLTVRGLIEAGCAVEAAFAKPGPLADEYRKSGSTVHFVDHGHWLAGGNALRTIRRWGREARSALRFVGLIRRLRPDVVYANTILGVAAVAAARALGVPSIWHIRELFDDVGGEMHAPLFGGRALVRRLVKHLPSRVVVNSEAVAENVLGCRSDPRVHVVPNAVGSRFFQPPGSSDECRRRLRLPLHVPIVGVPGTLRPVKGHGFFLEAAGRLVEGGWHGHFAVSGDGTSSYREQLGGQVDRLGLNQRVHFLGTLEDMCDFYGACDAVCVPSRSESFGRTVIEAFAMGVPVVATAVGGIREIVEHCKTGLLVPYGDVRRLADSIVRLLAAPQLRARISTQARAKARAEYREDMYQGRILSLVTEVARGGKHVFGEGLPTPPTGRPKVSRGKRARQHNLNVECRTRNAEGRARTADQASI